jgi:single-strand selective monofunctional uracil DNA glycosylase
MRIINFARLRGYFCRMMGFMSDISELVLRAGQELAEKAGGLTFGAPVAFTYNPLDYAWDPFERYVRRYGNSKKRVLYLGMNPGPFGMAQTGVPFGEIEAVRDWLQIEGKVGRPAQTHPKRPVEGFACKRSEVSGRRLWGLFRDIYGTADQFFAESFVANYCPLIWMSESGANVTPDKLPAETREKVDAICLAHLTQLIDILQPSILVGVGAYATGKFKETLSAFPGQKKIVGTLLHPSPASPIANKCWPSRPLEQLKELGIVDAKVQLPEPEKKVAKPLQQELPL